MRIWYVEVHLSDKTSEQIRKWEERTGKDAEDVLDKIVEKFFNEEEKSE